MMMILHSKQNILKLIFLVIVICLLSGCTGKVERVIEGWWTIDDAKVIYQNQDITFCLLSNSITFYSQECKMPITRRHCNELAVAYDANGIWEILEQRGSYKIKITSDNEIFKGVHNIRFENDPKNKLLKMIVESDELYFKCSKGLFNYDRNRQFIEELISLTN